MITTKKSGPPVPPRPNATLLSKSQSNSSMSLPPGRTVIYKSPSHDKPMSAHNQANDTLQHKVTKTTLPTRTSYSADNDFTPHGDDGIYSNGTEIFIATNNAISVSNVNCKNEPNVILDSGIDNKLHEGENGSDDNRTVWENSHKLDIVQKSPLASPRQNVSSKKFVKSNSENTRETMSMSHVIVLSEKDRVINNNIDELYYKRAVDDLIEIRNEQVIALVERRIPDQFGTNSILETSDNLENVNCYGSVVEKLFTEIACGEKAQENQLKLEQYIPVRTPSPLNVNIIDSNLLQTAKQTLQSDDVCDISEEKVTVDKKVTFHEQLISELAEMHKVEKPITRYSSSCSNDSSPNGTHRSRIRTADWVEVGDNGKAVLLSSCQISLEDSGMEDEERLDEISSGVGDSWDSVKDCVDDRMSLPGLPPLPKSLSTIENTGTHPHNTSNFGSIETQRGVSPVSRKTSTLDTQLAILRREMFGLRQLDLSLLSQLWALNESIQEFRTMIQEQEALSPPSPSPSPSDTNSVSSGDEGDSSIQDHNHPSAMQMQHQYKQQQHVLQQQQQQQTTQQQRMRAAPPPPPNRKTVKVPSRPQI
ncbi:uncharacterized protein LOC119075305 [Bradysia coprophila]|uniref:uncharacterized protein LOC119075305 n=1 Tax=Bradysia coprophila TaxID=38358 RepID=UPI00187D8B9F|nr:uncharacterized protein LOC119075305 [Bradysia coprophila]